MANRQSSWAAAQQKDRFGAQRDDAPPEMNDDVRGSADEDEAEFDEEEDDEADDTDDTDEGTF